MLEIILPVVKESETTLLESLQQEKVLVLGYTIVYECKG
jgi:hypothetical protein